ncbi:translation initiation factor eIF-2B subunit delta [Cryptococcus gattii Ru294]|uniref:Translation initiation factor eIF2B subunit delta n=2 Tax=Cryptococcus gattii TaxID=37769 RepID=E6R9S2_CRYGW|nr:Translation initiation factor eIF-2B delta subunit (eIF-2B GDP-GTP exchange factor), putative [Cryptococcus gattii WM276]KIR54756.1 translation initiation factor eIF-2B subunit delta [Cryptococcus gattii Ru294]KIR77661.1 translation initiation factor eIF-2B subunit delta [Cryptococcus gattii EJB2]KIY35967.1 translation initiation factor eIF-2B subunit delta [Cryptococcus gattii E566]KJE05465.1 translation initiation factor eIF-2B subunit delta [Cryptococcus gattii NT-10]ADV23533.1 Translati
MDEQEPQVQVQHQKQQKQKPHQPPSGEPKAKSAKELKKEKRAAAVAARAISTDGGVPEGPPGGKQSSSTTTSDGRHSPAVHLNSSSQNPASSAGPSAPRRPPNLPEFSAPTLFAIQQNLFFSHLPHQTPADTVSALDTGKIHPIIIRVGVLMNSGQLRGANARTIGMMSAFKEVIRDYECPDQAVLWKDLPVYLSPMIAWLETCRPKGVGGGNAIRWLKSEINRLGEKGDKSEAEQKSYLVDAIGLYLRDRIEFADQVIADSAKEKIKPGDTVVTFARSSVVERVLLEAWTSMREQDPDASFNVVVVDSRPLLEGEKLLKVLTAAGLPCTYILLPLLSSILPQADLVLLGASALHSDGALYSRAGTAVVAMLAKEHRVPVVACVETYKFGERVVLDGVATNELGDVEGLLTLPTNKPFALVKEGKPLPNNLTPLHVVYDVTPPSLITAVCTEIGFIPPSSVPTVLGKSSGVV